MKSKQDLTVAEALARVLATVSILDSETVDLLDALGRVLASVVVAQNDLPSFDNSAMDGYVLLSADSQSATRETPVTLQVVGDIAAGTWPDLTLVAGQAARIMTGAPIPAGATAVIPVEDTNEGWKNRERPLPEQVEIYRAVGVGDYIRPKADDIATGATILQAGHIIRPQEISIMASLGVSRVKVVRRPVVGILATGDELVEVDQPLAPGKIRNSNGYAQAAQVAAIGAIPLRLGIAGDTEEDVRSKLQAGLDAGVDMFISSAGVSVGAYDVVKAVLDSEGDVNFWRVRMRPGKPLAFGKYQGVPYAGLPGNPVSSMLSFDRFARPALLKMMGHTILDHLRVTATLQEAMTSDGRESYIRVILSQDGDQWLAQPTGAQGSHMISSLVKANGFLIIPEGVRKVFAGERLAALVLNQ
ncbi:MAG: gephyrin-like molybdotransferase Glp [Candidatus Promineifilaceae bacterium]